MANPFLLIGGIVVGVAAAGFGVLQVPGWVASAQDAAAANDLSHVKTLQESAARHGDGYQSWAELSVNADKRGTKMTTSDNVVVCTTRSDDRTKYAAVTKSASGTYLAEVNGGKQGKGATAAAALTNAGGLPAGVPNPMGSADSCATSFTQPGAAAAAQPVSTISYSVNCERPLQFGAPLNGFTGHSEWSDGLVEQYSNGALTGGAGQRTLPGSTGFTVTYIGTFDGGQWQRGNDCVRSVSSWTTESASPVNGKDMFSGMSNLTSVPAKVPALSDTRSMFSGDISFNSDISGWDVSQVKYFDSMFSSAWLFNADISGWNMSQATSLQAMFRDTRVFNQPIGRWDTSKVQNMQGVFNGSMFNQPLSAWKTSNVTDMSGMFGRIFNQNLSGWDVSKVTSYAGFSTTIQASYLPKFR